MARRKTAPSTSGPVAGEYEGSSGPVVLEPDPYLADGWVVYVNGVPSSHIIIGQPRELAFEYMRWIASTVRAHVGGHLDAESLRVTHLGGGACTMARYLADVYPRSRNTVVELDGKLAELVRTQFDIPRAPRVKIRVEDARVVAADFTPASRDVIIRDVFAGETTPVGLTTVDFFADCHRGLGPDGLYVANCGDHPDLCGAKAELAGMAEVWRHVAVVADPPMLKGRRYGNIVLLASDAELVEPPVRELLGGGVPAQFKGDAWTRRFFSGAVARRES